LPPRERVRDWRPHLPLCGVLAAVLLIYSNHFENSFHFDDAHSVQSNPYIRDLRNVPRFFTDARAFSVLPANRTYRPLVTLSLAVDYWLGNGLTPFYFHLSTFLWFLFQLVLMYFLFRRICDRALPDARNPWVALFATAWYGLHPVMAETVNYVIQRGEVFSTLGVIASVLLYAAAPGLRKWGLYLLPAAAAALSKPPALVFPAILAVYIWLFEEDAGARKLGRTLARSAPALALAAALGWLLSAMTPRTFTPGASSAYGYLIAQPLVALRYFRAFFLPTGLSADTEHGAATGVFDGWTWLGFLFLIALAWTAFRCSARRETRPIAFGLFWFLLALAPTSLFPMAEVENDHRMFFPFAGLVLSVCWAGALWLYRSGLDRAVVAVVCILVLDGYAWGAHQRNEVWRSEESLWYDAALKSPHNGRALMNYGLTLMAKGEYPKALDCFQRALLYNPSYYVLEINLGVVNAALLRDAEAEQHFRRSIDLAPSEAQTHFYYARWLRGKGRVPEAISHLETAIAANADYLDSRSLLTQIRAEQAGRLPPDRTAAGYVGRTGTASGEIAAAEVLVKRQPAPGNFLSLSLLYCRAARHKECIAASEEALKLKPDFAEAYNNIAAGYEGLEMWDQAIAAARKAIQLKPDFQLARNNLAWSESQKRKAAAAGK